MTLICYRIIYMYFSPLLLVASSDFSLKSVFLFLEIPPFCLLLVLFICQRLGNNMDTLLSMMSCMLIAVSSTSCDVWNKCHIHNGGLDDLFAALNYVQMIRRSVQETSGLVACCWSDLSLYKTLFLNCSSSCKHIL